MRAFGIFAAFIALSTSVLAAPLPAASAHNDNALTVRYDSLVPLDAGIAVRNVAGVEVRAEAELVHRRDNGATVNANVASVVFDLKTDIDALIAQILAILSDTTSDVPTKVSKILVILNKLLQEITGATAKAGLAAVGSLFGIGGSTTSTTNAANFRAEDVAGTLVAIVKDVIDILTKVAGLIKNLDPSTAAVLQAIVAVLSGLLSTFGGIVGGSALPSITDLIGPLLAELGIPDITSN